MKRPKIPQKFNLIYWLRIAGDLELSSQFEERGNKRQRAKLDLAQRYLRWLDIQKKKDRKYFEKQLKKRVRRRKKKKLKWRRR